jgi:cytoskeleton protein RodZ
MDAVAEDMSESRETIGETTTVGVLIRGRERLAMSVADVARHLRLSVRQVEAIEAGDFGKLPGGPFVRGFVRNYARLVGVDPEPLIRSIDAQPPAEERAIQTPLPKEIPFPTGQTRPWSRYAAIGAMLVVALALLAYESYRDYLPRMFTGKRAAEPPETAPAAQPVTPPQPPAATSPQLPAASAAGEPPIAMAAPALPSAGGAQPPQATPAATPPELAAVQMQFGHESWVEIRDRDGKLVFTGTNAAGSERVVEGAPPLALIIGHASKVRVTWRNMPVDLAPFTKVDVARLTLE